MKHVKTTLVTMLMVAVSQVGVAYTATAATMPSAMPSDKRIKFLRYDPNDIYTIYTLYGYQTSIEFARNERVRTISVGDKSLWQIVPAEHRLFIRPMGDNVITNMTVITDRRTYQFDIKSGSGELKDNPNMVYVARFTYPPKKKPQPKVAIPVVTGVPAVPVTAGKLAAPTTTKEVTPAPIPMVKLPPAEPMRSVELRRDGGMSEQPNISPIVIEPAPVAPKPDAKANFNYTYTGPDNLAPLQLYDDGATTYMRFDDLSEGKPRVFVVADKMDIPLDYEMRDGFVVVRGVHGHIVLDYDGEAESNVHIYNENLMPASM